MSLTYCAANLRDTNTIGNNTFPNLVDTNTLGNNIFAPDSGVAALILHCGLAARDYLQIPGIIIRPRRHKCKLQNPQQIFFPNVAQICARGAGVRLTRAKLQLFKGKSLRSTKHHHLNLLESSPAISFPLQAYICLRPILASQWQS